MTDRTRTPIVEITIAAPLEAVWRALRDTAEIRRWHGWEFEGLDAEIDIIYGSGALASQEAGTIDLPEVNTRFALERRGDETVVRVTKAGPAGDDEWERYFDEVDEGWITFFNQLRFMLERHPGEERRTIHLDGVAGPDGGPLTPSRLGLDAAERAAPGERWEGIAAWGEPLAGEVLHRTTHQVGLSVESWNDAMLVLHAKPAEIRPPYGGGRAIVSTYGLGDEALAELRERWEAWWRQGYTSA
jgi:hypothetical protein